MIPIQELLSRIRWDEEFGRSEFQVGYYDRVEKAIVYVSFRDMFFEPEAHAAFALVDRDGVIHRVPLHRIKEVWRDGALIWHREH